MYMNPSHSRGDHHSLANSHVGGGVERHDSHHQTPYHHYSGSSSYNNYSIYDFYERMPPSYFESEKYKYINSMNMNDRIFKIYMGGMGVVGLYILFRILDK